MPAATDKWHDWLLHRRFGGDTEAAACGMRMLERVRDAVLDEARLEPGDVLLDVGCGDGLIAFGAIDRAGPSGSVIFSDISQPLLDRCSEIAASIGVLDRCQFVQASADDLSPIADTSVDAVTTRSVLIYVSDKARAFREFHRVLKPGGRIALWEPINRFTALDRRDGDVPPEIAALAARLHDYYLRRQPLDSDPMMNFDERDLLRLAEDAGFRTVNVTLRMYVSPAEPLPWSAWLAASGNPNLPSTADILREIFTDDERALFERHMRPLVERGGRPYRTATATVAATKAAA